MLHAQQPYDVTPVDARLLALSTLLTAHGVSHAIASGRLYADSLVMGESGVDDLTDMTRANVLVWLGY